MYPQLAKIGIVVAIIGALYGSHVYVVHKAVDSKEQELRAEFRQQMLESIEDATRTEDRLRISLNQKIADRDKQITNITAERNRLNRLLNSRPSRQDNPTPSDGGSSCTGAKLYREDGEFLAGEAARAEKLIKERDYYYLIYVDTYTELEKLRNGSH